MKWCQIRGCSNRTGFRQTIYAKKKEAMDQKSISGPRGGPRFQVDHSILY